MVTKKIRNVLIWGALLATLLFFLFPIFWVLSCSFKRGLDIFSIDRTFRFMPILTNYEYLFERQKFQYPLFNSAIYAIFGSSISAFIGSLAAYGLTRLQSRLARTVTYWIIIIKLLPPIVMVIPLYVIFKNIGLLGTHLSMVIAYSIFNIPFIVWFMQGFFHDVGTELEEAAMVDGCGVLGAFLRVTLPLVAPGLAVAVMFSFIFIWNEFLFALVLTNIDTKSVTVVIGTFWSDLKVQWGMIFAAMVVTIIPLYGMAVFLQKYLVRGLTMGALKE